MDSRPSRTGTGLSAAAALLCLFVFGGCVTEPTRRTVSVRAGTAGRIYPAAPYYGQWHSGSAVLKFQRPPAAAVIITPHPRPYRARTIQYRIVALTRNKDGSDTFQLQPVSGGLGRTITLTIDDNNRLLRETGATPRLWRRAGSDTP